MSIGTMSFLLYCLTTVYCLSSYNIAQARTARGITDYGVNYLKKFGYLSESKGGQSQEAQDLSQSVRAFQRFAGLNETGQFDQATVELMSSPRCGDKDPITRGKRKRRYILEGSTWKKKHLTYRILNDPYNGPTNREVMTPELVSKTIKAAFQKWSLATQLTFTELHEGEADIMIKFIAGDHGDNYNFDGRGGSLAHAFYPGRNTGRAGDAHFDLDEKFSLTEPESTSFLWVTTHEFGHSLGLRHSRVKDAVMYPFYQAGKLGDVKLTLDDKNGIQVLYGKPTGRKYEKRIVLPSPPREECQYSFTAFFHDKHRKRVYAFRDHEFYVLNQHGKSKRAKRVEKHWKKLTVRVKAAYTRNDGYTIFFTQYRYYKYLGQRYIEGPTYIEDYGLPTDLRDMDAAISYPGNGFTYFFKGQQYWKYNEKEKTIYSGYPKLIKDFWPGVPDNLDGALQGLDGETYFFKGSQFYKFDHFSRSVLPAYPKPIGPYWLGCQQRNVILAKNPDRGNSALSLRTSYVSILITLVWAVV